METPVDPYYMTKNSSMLQALGYFPEQVIRSRTTDDPIIRFTPIMQGVPNETSPNLNFRTEMKETKNLQEKFLTPTNILIGIAVVCAAIILSKTK